MKTLVGRIALAAILPILVLLLWHAASRSAATSGILPGVAEVMDIALHPSRMPGSIDAPPLLFSAQTSLLRVALGFIGAVVFGVPVGLLVGRHSTSRALIAPSAHAFWIVSPIAWIPVAILILGVSPLSDLLFGELHGWQYPRLYEIQPAILLIVGWGAFLPILLSTANGASGVPRPLLEAVELMGGGPWFRLRHVILPHALPSMLTGMRLGSAMAWRVIIAAELYPGTRSGLGHTIEVSITEGLQYQYAFAAILYIMVIGLAADLLFAGLERWACHWKTEAA